MRIRSSEALSAGNGWVLDRIRGSGYSAVIPRPGEVVVAMAVAQGPGFRDVGEDLLRAYGGQRFGTILVDPPWRFINRTGKVAPEHRRLHRYDTMSWKEIAALPVGDIAAEQSHLYLWSPNTMVPDALRVMEEWGFGYKTMLIWHKVRKDGGSDGRGVGFYFRNVTEPVLFGIRGGLRTLAPGRSQVNLLATRKREHSRKPDELYPIIEACSPAPRIELFARYGRDGWAVWGDEADADVMPRGRQHKGYGA